MPIVEQSGINWAKEIDETEVDYNEDSGFRTKVDYKTEDGRKFKITSIYRVEKVKVPRSVAERKKWPKFGDASNDPPGVNSATTVVSDEVFMQFLTNKEEEKQEALAAPIPAIKCRFCKGDHWSSRCPIKDKMEQILQDKEVQQQSTITSSSSNSGAGGALSAGASSGAYKPPSMRGSASAVAAAASALSGKKFDMGGGKGGSFANKDDYTVRVTNLPEEATENDLMELFKPFGKVNRIFLAKDKNTQVSRGFAFVNFAMKDDAQRAIWGVNDYGYNHLILKVEWARPSKDTN